MAATALVVALIASACSSGSNAVPPKSALDPTSAGPGLHAQTLPKKSATVTYTPIATVAATAGVPLGIKKWAFYGWSDGRTMSAVGLNASGGITWEADVVNDSAGNPASITTNIGTTIVRPTSSSQTVTVYKKNASDVGIANALRTDMEVYAGYTGGGGAPGGGPQPASATRSTSSGNGSVYASAAAFSLDLAHVLVTVGEAGTLAAIGPIGWLALGVSAGVMFYEMYKANEENQAPVGADPGGLGPTPGPSYGPGPGTVTRVCASDNFGNLTCWYTFY